MMLMCHLLEWSNSNCECMHCVGLLAIVPPQGCESILIEILQFINTYFIVSYPHRYVASEREFSLINSAAYVAVSQLRWPHSLVVAQ